jgi:hypothetical protein
VEVQIPQSRIFSVLSPTSQRIPSTTHDDDGTPDSHRPLVASELISLGSVGCEAICYSNKARGRRGSSLT